MTDAHRSEDDRFAFKKVAADSEGEAQSGHHETSFVGLTKRELFAAMAMQGILACPESRVTYGLAAEYAVQAADALLKELSK